MQLDRQTRLHLESKYLSLKGLWEARAQQLRTLWFPKAKNPAQLYNLEQLYLSSLNLSLLICDMGIIKEPTLKRCNSDSVRVWT